MRRFTLQAKLASVLLGFIVTLVILVVLTGRTVRDVSHDVSQAHHRTLPHLVHARDLAKSYEQWDRAMSEAILLGQVGYLEHAKEHSRQFRELLEADPGGRAPGAAAPDARIESLRKDFDRQGPVSLELALRRLVPGDFPALPDGAPDPVAGLEAENDRLRSRIQAELEAHVTGLQADLDEKLGGIREDLSRKFRGEILIVAVSIALFVVGFFFLARRIVVPLRALSAATARVADGDLSEEIRVPIRSDDEIGDLARAFRRMTRGLRRSTVSRDQLDRILESIPDPVIVCHRADQIVTVNAAALRLLDYGEEEIKGLPMDSIVSDRSWNRERFHVIRDRLRDGGRFENEEVLWRTIDGLDIPVMVSGAALTDDRGITVGTVYSAVDFRERKRIEDELRRATTAAEEGARSKSEFLATMSHEIRTPMTAILGFAENLLDPNLPDADRLDSIRTIRSNGRHLLEIINSILDISKIEAGKLDVNRVPVPIFDLLDDFGRLMTGPAAEKGLEFRLEYLTPLPDKIQSDPTRLRQILINLAGNAVKFTSEGTILVVVAHTPRLSPEGEDVSWLDITIVDSGIGMSSEALDHVFDPFTQADGTTSRRFGGTGLGLTISRRLAQLLGGDIKVRSRQGEGSAFRVRFEAAAAPDARIIHHEEYRRPDSLPGIVAPSSTSVPEIRDRRVLVAEDNAVNQRLIGHILKRAGATIVVAENGRIAVERCIDADEAGEPFDVILMDIQMPEMDGLAATRALRECGIRTPIIALTANAMESDRIDCLEAGADAFETKPIDRRSLLETVGRLTGHPDSVGNRFA